jgi:hypothetical protein
MAGVSEHPVARQIIETKISRSWKRRPHLRRQHFLNPALVPIQSRGGIYLGHAPTIEFQGVRLSRVLTKIVKCLFFHTSGYSVPSDYVVQVHPDDPFLYQTPDEYIQAMAGPTSFGDDVFGWCCSQSSDDPDNTFWLLIFYRQAAWFARTVHCESPEAILGSPSKLVR